MIQFCLDYIPGFYWHVEYVRRNLWEGQTIDKSYFFYQKNNYVLLQNQQIYWSPYTQKRQGHSIFNSIFSIRMKNFMQIPKILKWHYGQWLNWCQKCNKQTSNFCNSSVTIHYFWIRQSTQGDSLDTSIFQRHWCSRFAFHCLIGCIWLHSHLGKWILMVLWFFSFISSSSHAIYWHVLVSVVKHFVCF